MNRGVGGVLLSPVIYRVRVRAGQKGTLPFTLENPNSTRSQAHLEISSFLPAEWTYLINFGVTHERDAAAWFEERVIDDELSVGQRKSRSFRFAVPRRLDAGSYWCMMRMIARPIGSTTGAGVIIQAPIILVVGNAKPVLRTGTPILDLVDAARPNLGLLAKLPLENTGSASAIVGGAGNLKNLVNNKILDTFSIDDLNLLPGTKRHLNFATSKLLNGRYRMTFQSDIDGRRLPPVVSDYAVVDGVPQLLTKESMLELPPISVNPEAISVAVPAGSFRSQTVRVTNISDAEISLDIAARSLVQASNGSIGLGEGPLPANIEISVTPAVLSIRPRSTGTIRVLARVAPTATGDQWFGLALVERGKTGAFAESVHSNITIPGTTRPMLEIGAAQIDTVRDRPLGLKYVVRNSGNQALQLVPSAVVLEAGIRLVARLEVPVPGSGGILPGAELPHTIQLPPTLKAGEYVVEVTYQYGEQLFARLRVPINIKGTAIKPAPASKPSKPALPPTKRSSN